MRIRIHFEDNFIKSHPNYNWTNEYRKIDYIELSVTAIYETQIEESVKIPNVNTVDYDTAIYETQIEESVKISNVNAVDYHLEYKRNTYYVFNKVVNLQEKIFEKVTYNVDDIKNIEYIYKWW